MLTSLFRNQNFIITLIFFILKVKKHSKFQCKVYFLFYDSLIIEFCNFFKIEIFDFEFESTDVTLSIIFL